MTKWQIIFLLFSIPGVYGAVWLFVRAMAARDQTDKRFDQ